MPAARCRLHVIASAGAAESELSRGADGELRVRISAPAREGKANAALVKLLASRLGVPPSSVRIARGTTSRHKVVEIEGLALDEAMARLGLR